MDILWGNVGGSSGIDYTNILRLFKVIEKKQATAIWVKITHLSCKFLSTKPEYTVHL